MRTFRVTWQDGEAVDEDTVLAETPCRAVDASRMPSDATLMGVVAVQVEQRLDLDTVPKPTTTTRL